LGIERVEERRGFAKKTQSVLRRQKDDETVKMKGFKGSSNVFGSANDS